MTVFEIVLGVTVVFGFVLFIISVASYLDRFDRPSTLQPWEPPAALRVLNARRAAAADPNEAARQHGSWG